jgi:hypothetical protein
MDGIKAIVNPSNPAWFCKTCCKAHHILYRVSRNENYCPSCVPDEVKEKAEYVNQIGEPVTIIEDSDN